ncbi:MAG: DEAD/DEAH box helicase, partial [Myxococcota bacterium]
MMSALDPFGPATRTWFARAFPGATSVQRDGWPHLVAGAHALLLAPTGSGKTLAAFLACLDRLTRLPVTESAGVRVVYISPLKALVHDVEKNLRAPLVGIERAAEGHALSLRPVHVDVRTGDTPAEERRRQIREPADILVTTPESLFLLLTSEARETLRTVETVIVDEIHVVAGSKRGAHLALSLERLSQLCARDPQRIGLSATVRPVERVSRFLGGDRVVEVVDASEPPRLDLAIKVPLDDMDRPPRPVTAATLDHEQGPPEPRRGRRGRRSVATGNPQPAENGIWPSLYPELLREIRAHRSTLVFTNSRLLCERLAQKLNELAGEPLVRAHHGSLSHAKRAEIEEELKEGRLPALVATSSLELGIDMGAIDLVLLVESPGAVSSGLQRVGRAGHQVGAASRGIVYPKFRGDLLESAVVAQQMMLGAIEEVRVPRNCLDVLAQHLVAMIAMEDQQVEDLYRAVRRSHAYEDLSREMFLAVLDMLAGRYPSDDFHDLAPRIVWDRTTGALRARRGAKALAIMNAGTIPDRGLYRVHVGEGGPRIGELDEEMVHETRQGDTIVLGASSWRVEQIQQDRVLVSPAPGQPGRLPFWRGERAGRPLELGRALGAFVRELDGQNDQSRRRYLAAHTVLDDRAQQNLLSYLEEQRAVSALPTDREIVVERFRDELGDWRVCILTPFGRRVHAPWALALEARFSELQGFAAQVLYSDDGVALQFPDSDEPPALGGLFPDTTELEDRVTEQLSQSALFATRFREAAARALLLPRRRFVGRAPLWLQRRKSQQLLAVASRHPNFPLVLETYRECLQDVFDLPALRELLAQVERREVRVTEVFTTRPSPFARSLVYQYVAAYLYDGDAPVAERRAAALSLDRAMLRDLLGQEELRDLLVPAAIDEVERELTRADPSFQVAHEDALHDLLRRLGDLTRDEISARALHPPDEWLASLETQRRVLPVRVSGEERYIAVEDAARYRDALGVTLPRGVPSVFLAPAAAAFESLIVRFAQHRGPFRAQDIALRYGLVPAQVEPVLVALEASGRLVSGALRPGGYGKEWCDPEVLRRLRQRSLAHLRNEVSPVAGEAYARFLLGWHGLTKADSARRRPLVERLEGIWGVPLPFSDLETRILPARVDRYEPRLLDELGANGQVLWVGAGALGPRDGRVMLLPRDRAAELLATPSIDAATLDGTALKLYRMIDEGGACFFSELQGRMQVRVDELVELLFDLVW